MMAIPVALMSSVSRNHKYHRNSTANIASKLPPSLSLRSSSVLMKSESSRPLVDIVGLFAVVLFPSSFRRRLGRPTVPGKIISQK